MHIHVVYIDFDLKWIQCHKMQSTEQYEHVLTFKECDNRIEALPR